MSEQKLSITPTEQEKKLFKFLVYYARFDMKESTSRHQLTLSASFGTLTAPCNQELPIFRKYMS
jgi:hypothetical protein